MAFLALSPEPLVEARNVEAFVEEFGITWPVGYGADSSLRALGVRGFPTLFVVSREGKVVWNDEMSGSLDSAIDQALAIPVRSAADDSNGR